jgi:subtilase family serine protease
MKTWNQQRKRRLLAWFFCVVGIGVVLLGALLGATLVRSQSDGAHAANVQSISVSKMTLQAMDASLLPIVPMYGMAVKKDIQNGVLNAVPTGMSCLMSQVRPLCYSPQRLQQAYGVSPLLAQGITGKGRIITIIDAFQDPTIKQELHLFDQLFGLNDPQLNILTPFGLTPFNRNDPAQTGFATEIALDVEWAHAMAPEATIDLVLGNVRQETLQGELTALLQATGYAVEHNIGSVISQSFGTGETCVGTALLQQAHRIFQQAQAQHQTVLASAGDTGSGVVHCNAKGQPVTLAQGANFPASDPLVTAVGGTTLLTSPTGHYLAETAWNEAQRGAGATGGAPSSVFAQPVFQQQSVQSIHRVPTDLSLDADPFTGVAIVSSQVMPGTTALLPIGGTSVGSPVAAGMVALFDQAAGRRLGFLNGALYTISHSAVYMQAFHDIQTGNNVFVFRENNGNIVTVPGFQAGIGWDAPTGVGTPNAANLVKVLVGFV